MKNRFDLDNYFLNFNDLCDVILDKKTSIMLIECQDPKNYNFHKDCFKIAQASFKFKKIFVVLEYALENSEK